MTRLVRGTDGRMWTLRGRIEWSTPATVDDFEHDVAGGYASAVILFAMLLLLVLVLVAWTPSQVLIPGWLVFAVCVLVLFFPVRWLLRRPWLLVANTPGNLDEDQSAERWTGTVRGVFRVRQMVARVARDIEVYSAPNADGPLHPVD